jgi:hypothetical protein
MKAGVLSGLLAAALIVAGVADASAQSTKMPSTLRYGTGYIDVPDASVLPHLAILGTYSGFYVDMTDVGRALTDSKGRVIGYGDDYTDWRQDGSVTIGLFDRLELGATFQNFSDAGTGGTMVGGHGRLAILRPERQGLGLAVGARYVTAPTFDDVDPGENYQPTRLGFPDTRFYEDYDQPWGDVSTELTPYVMANLMLQGWAPDWLPEYDVTIAAGWGDGMFRDGRQLDWYADSYSNGWVFGTAIHMKVGEQSLLNLMADYNGFDANAGFQFDFRGFRVGAFVLGLNYMERVTEYRSPKFGILASLALCPGDGDGRIMCRAELMERVKPDTVQLPPPPADTVVVEREVAPPLPTGTPTDICLATGRSERVYVTASGDTLVGPNRVSLSSMSGVVFEGVYADGMDWFVNDEAVRFENRDYQKSGGEVRLDCANIMLVGQHEGVNLFADVNADKPYETLYVPVRPGVWQAYQTGLRRTRG